MKKFIILLITVCFAAGIQSCSNDDVPSDAQASFEMRAISGASTAAARIANTGFTFTEVLAGVTEIELETLEENLDEEENGEEENEEVEFEGNFIIDLLTGTSDPEFGLSELLAGVYEEVEIEFDNILEGEKTLIVNFNFIADGSTTPTYVEFSTSQEFELEIENEAGISLDEGTINAILVTLDLDLLLSSIDFSSLTVDQDGVIRINENSNSNIMEAIFTNLEDAFEAEEDEEDEGDDD